MVVILYDKDHRRLLDPDALEKLKEKILVIKTCFVWDGI
jgi:hypothetical protein